MHRDPPRWVAIGGSPLLRLGFYGGEIFTQGPHMGAMEGSCIESPPFWGCKGTWGYRPPQTRL